MYECKIFQKLNTAECIWSVMSSISNPNLVSMSLLPRSVQKRPIGLRLEIQIK